MDIRDFADNEVIVIEGPNYTGAVVTTTGDRDKFKAEMSIRAGITTKVTLTYDDVAQLVVDSIVNGKELKKNSLFKGGIREAFEHCRKIYIDSGMEPIKYDSLEEEPEEYEKMIAKDQPYVPS
jgi:hypothetical protein